METNKKGSILNLDELDADSNDFDLNEIDLPQSSSINTEQNVDYTPTLESILNEKDDDQDEFLNLDQINNLIIVTPPKSATIESTTTAVAFNFLDEDLLGKDLLKYEELNRNYLSEYNKLDRNFLDTDYLYNLLDVANSQLLTNELTEFNALLPKYTPASGLKYYIENDFVTLYKETYNAYAQVTTPITQTMSMTLTQEGIEIKQVVNYSGNTSITIRQSN